MIQRRAEIVHPDLVRLADQRGALVRVTIPGLELDVLGTDVVGLPVYAGQAVAITLP